MRKGAGLRYGTGRPIGDAANQKDDIVQTIVVATFLLGGAVAAAAATEDARRRRLPNVHVALIVLTGLGGFALAARQGDEAMPLPSMMIGTAVFAGPWLISHLISPASIGFGDIKFSAALGLYLGWLSPILAVIGFFAASASFTVAHLLSRGRMHEQRWPFGPHLLVGWALAILLALVL